MNLLCTQAEAQMVKHAHPNLGRLVQPREYSSLRATAARGICWAADNDAFGGFDAEAQHRFERMLETITGVPGCLFVVAPDVVGDGGLTRLMFDEWAPVLQRRRLPIAYVVQEDGIEHETPEIPWGQIAALFIGCALDEEKLGARVRRLVRMAKGLGKWVHMGRVNTAKRIAYAREIGCDSVDGTKWVRWRDTYLDEGLGLVSAPPQLSLGAVA